MAIYTNAFLEINSKPDINWNAFHIAATDGKIDDIRTLLNPITHINTPEFYDIFCCAAINGHSNIIELMIAKGLKPNFKDLEGVTDSEQREGLSAMGYAILHRHTAVIATLCNSGVNIDEVAREKHNDNTTLDGALTVYCTSLFHYKSLEKKENHIETLQLILSKQPKMHTLQKKTLWIIGIDASCKELHMLLNAGLDPNSICQNEKGIEFKGIDNDFNKPAISLLDVAVMQAEISNRFEKHADSINKVKELISRGANVLSINNTCGQTYLHQTSNPTLICQFVLSGLDVTTKAKIVYDQSFEFTPLDLAHTEESIDAFTSLDINITRFPYIKGTTAHINALARLKFKTDDQSNSLYYLIKAYNAHDIGAFIALIGAGVDLNQCECTSKWTCMHELFSSIFNPSSDSTDNYKSIAFDDFHLRLINILIKNGALPLKDNMGRTPLMCLSQSSACHAYILQIINLYIDFEADYYKLNREEYRLKFKKLRLSLSPSEKYVSDKEIPALHQRNIEDFWNSFENNAKFKPV